MSAHSPCEVETPQLQGSEAAVHTQIMSGGYDLSLFTSPPDSNFLCSVCHGVLKRPVRLPCSHIFCKKCILRWLARQKTCPCCRKEVKRKKMVHVNKLQKAIGRLEVKCKNAEAGCLVTCPLAHRKGHQNSCPFELMACPNQGCTAQMPNQQHCQHGIQQCCSLDHEAILDQAERVHHNCHRELRAALDQYQERSRSLALCLLQRRRKMNSTINLINRQLAQLRDFLEDEAQHISLRQEDVEVTPDRSIGDEVWEMQGQSTL